MSTPFVLAWITLQACMSTHIDVKEQVSQLLHKSQALWDRELEEVRRTFQAQPAQVLEALIAALDDETVVSGELVESTMYSVRGNALTVLEDFCDLRLDGQHRDWIGFRVHDHRGMPPEKKGAKAPWEAWMRTRQGLAVERWFHGLSARELHVLQLLLRSDHKQWNDEALAPARALGNRAYPFLLERLKDDEWAHAGERQTDQANRLLAVLSGGEPELLERYDLLTLDPRDPLRAEGIALVRNRLAMAAVHERWSIRLLCTAK